MAKSIVRRSASLLTRLFGLLLAVATVASCNEQRDQVERLQGPADSSTGTIRTPRNELERFMTCDAPFHPTLRPHDLIGKGIITAPPLERLDGIPYFAPSKDERFFGERVLLVAAFDAGEWDDRFYAKSPGTTASPQTSVVIAAKKGLLESRLPIFEKERLTLTEDSQLLNWAPAVHGISPGDVTTVVTCYKSRTVSDR